MSKSYKVFIIGNPKNHDSVNNVWQNNIVNKLTEYKDNRISFVCTQNYFDKPYSNETKLWELNQMQDAGLTGRKIVVDNYQSFANVGGGAFSGKDPTKVDRSAAYKARQLSY